MDPTDDGITQRRDHRDPHGGGGTTHRQDDIETVSIKKLRIVVVGSLDVINEASYTIYASNTILLAFSV